MTKGEKGENSNNISREYNICKLDIAVHMIEENVKQLELESSKIYKVVENVDDNLQKNNLRLKGVKERVQIRSSKSYWRILLTGCLSSDRLWLS